MAIVTIVCGKCGAKLEFDDTRDFGFCQFCGEKIAVSETARTMSRDAETIRENMFSSYLGGKYAEAEASAKDLLSVNDRDVDALTVLLNLVTMRKIVATSKALQLLSDKDRGQDHIRLAVESFSRDLVPGREFDLLIELSGKIREIKGSFDILDSFSSVKYAEDSTTQDDTELGRRMPIAIHPAFDGNIYAVSMLDGINTFDYLDDGTTTKVMMNRRIVFTYYDRIFTLIEETLEDGVEAMRFIARDTYRLRRGKFVNNEFAEGYEIAWKGTRTVISEGKFSDEAIMSGTIRTEDGLSVEGDFRNAPRILIDSVKKITIDGMELTIDMEDRKSEVIDTALYSKFHATLTVGGETQKGFFCIETVGRKFSDDRSLYEKNNDVYFIESKLLLKKTTELDFKKHGCYFSMTEHDLVMEFDI